MATSLPYQEPSITEILTLSSFLLALNIVNAVLDKTLYSGLVGQVLLGIAWGTPGAKWLSSSSDDLEPAVVQLGYLGLLLIVFEGGLSTSIQSTKANLLLSTCVALTGIAAPIALSFAVLPSMRSSDDTSVQAAFAAGAALCSTSLGTTFAVLSACGLASTRLGCVLATAAMMDDVVGLVMVQVVASLGSSGSDAVSATTVLRPVLVSVAFAVVPFLACRYVVRPAVAYLRLRGVEKEKTGTWKKGVLWLVKQNSRQGAFVVHTGLLLALVAGASFAGASVLLAAYIAGILVAWWDAEEEELEVGNSGRRITDNNVNVPAVGDGAGEATETTSTTTNTATTATNNTTTYRHHEQEQEPSRAEGYCAPGADSAVPLSKGGCDEKSRTTGVVVYEHYYSQAVNHVLKPFFFASIGFSIPISQMFERSILWRGIVYAVLMMIGKLFCGMWLVRFPLLSTPAGKKGGAVLSFIRARYHALLSVVRRGSGAASTQQRQQPQQESRPEDNSTSGDRRRQNTEDDDDAPVPLGYPSQAPQIQPPPPPPPPQTPPAKPLSLYPAGIISFAMVARGEIGFLISAVAESKGVFRNTSENEGRSDSGSGSGSGTGPASELFLIVTWAIVLCTIIGPVCVGLLVKRIKRLENRGSASSGGAGGSSTRRRDVLGVWGVS